MVPCPWARDAAALLPRRGRRRAPHAQRRVRHLPLGPDHARAEPARRRRRVPAHGRGRVGPRRPRRGAARVPGADRAGDRLGLRREPPRQPHGHARAPRPTSSTSTSSSRSTSGCRCASATVSASGSSASRSGGSPRRRASCSPTTGRVHAWRARRGRAAAVRPRARRHRDLPASRRSTPTSCAPRAPTGRAASRTTRTSAATRRSPTSSSARACHAHRLARAARAPTPRADADHGSLTTSRVPGSSPFAPELGGARDASAARLETRPRRVRASSSSNFPGSPAVFMRPCMNSTLGSSSPRAIATASAYGRVNETSASPSGPRPTSAPVACSVTSPSGLPVTEHSTLAPPTDGAAARDRVEPFRH